jgi:hypothetical protein
MTEPKLLEQGGVQAERDCRGYFGRASDLVGPSLGTAFFGRSLMVLLDCNLAPCVHGNLHLWFGSTFRDQHPVHV